MDDQQRYDPEGLRALLAGVAAGEVNEEEALARLRALPFAQLLDARVDHHRDLRTGVPETIFGAGKTRAQIEAIARELHARSGFALATRVLPAHGAALAASLGAGYDPVSHVLRWGSLPPSGKRVAVVAAGTSDLPVFEEAAQVLEAFGHHVVRRSDVGVAGLHRLLPEVETLDACAAIVVVAGMDGALPGVVAGLVRRPVVAVPTSVGYGASFGGLAALLTMLSACAPGVAVVNIDNGFGAAAFAHKLLAN